MEVGSADARQGSYVIKELLKIMEDVAKKSLMYSRASSFLSAVGFVLFVSAALAAVAYVLSYGAYWQLLVASVALTAAMFAADKLSDRYYHKALKELDRLESLAYITALSAGPAGQAAGRRLPEDRRFQHRWKTPPPN
jgi:hypothetical protein